MNRYYFKFQTPDVPAVHALFKRRDNLFSIRYRKYRIVHSTVQLVDEKYVQNHKQKDIEINVARSIITTLTIDE